MTLERFVARLQGAGCDLHVEDLLDAFWLATRGRTLSLHGPGPGASALREPPDPPPEDEVAGGEGGSTPPGAAGTSTPAPSRRERRDQAPVYPSGPAEPAPGTVKASPVALPAGQPLPGRLQLARALRPLRERWPSRTTQEIDERRTVEASAAASTVHRRILYPVFRPVPEPWFDAHVVLEDDPAIDLWRDTLQGFCRMLEDTGAFRSVQSWRLRGSDGSAAASGAGPRGAYLEGPTGFRAPTRLLAGRGVRRLIFFVTHGNAAGWLDGRYARVLAPWARTSSLAILHLFDRYRWDRGTLGEPHGTCAVREPGAPTADLDLAIAWWRAPPDQAGLVPIPAVPLTAAGLSDWALTLMGRGRVSPVFLLDPAAPGVGDAPVSVAPDDHERAVAQLRESSPGAFRLAVSLAASAFTIPVARVVQEAQLGAAASQSQLAEVLLSGLVYAHAPTPADPGAGWFECYPAARALLLRSLRESDALAIGAALEERVSRYMERISGRSISFRALVPDADGKYLLPDWAQPFARFGLAVLSPRADAKTPSQRLEALVAATTPDVLDELARYAASIAPGEVLQPGGLEPGLWRVLLNAGVIAQDSAGRWRFLPGLEPLLARLAAGAAPTGPTPFRDRLSDGSLGPEMVWLPGGSFRMGSPEAVGEDYERPAHAVALSHYAIGKYPVTVGEFRRFVTATGYRTEAETGSGAWVREQGLWGEKPDANWRKPYMDQDDRHPVVCVSWNDALAYCDWVGNETGQTYGLLTEAQWEHACRAGSEGAYCFGDDAARLGDYAWYSGNADGGTHPVGKKLPNAWGLHDLHGNAWEWCRDWYSGDYYARLAIPVGSAVRTDAPAPGAANGPHSGPYGDSQSTRSAASDAAVAASSTAVAASSGEQPFAEDPSGPESGPGRVVRGGAWNLPAGYCRSAARDDRHPSGRISYLGFRLSRTGSLHSYPFTFDRASEMPQPIPGLREQLPDSLGDGKAMPALKLFLGHSWRFDDTPYHHTRDDPNLRFLKNASDAIQERYGSRIQVLVDVDPLIHRDDWNGQHNDWLAACHAAVVFISHPGAERSHWFLRETSILSWRVALDKEFVLIPVILDGEATATDLDRIFPTIQGIQSIHSPRIVGDIVDGIARLLGPLSDPLRATGQTPFERLQFVIARFLRSAPAYSLALLLDACGIAFDSGRVLDANDVALLLVRFLMAAGSTSPSDLFSALRRILDHVTPLPSREEGFELLYATRALWVDPAAAAQIVHASRSRIPVAMNGALLLHSDTMLRSTCYTAERYLERAFPDPHRYRIILSSQSFSTLEDLRDRIRYAVLGRRMPAGLSDSQLDRAINREWERIVLVLDYNDQLDPSALHDILSLYDTYKNILMIMHTENYELMPSGPDGVRFIELRVDLETERAAFFAERSVVADFDERFGRAG